MADAHDEFETAMREAANAAWEHDWERAIEAYHRAAQLHPSDPSALAGLGLAYMEAGRLEDALGAYEEVGKLAPNDPIPFEKAADILERLGRVGEAAERHMAVADIYVARKNMERAIANWERASQLSPSLLQAHTRLAWAYEKTNQSKQAVQEYVTLAALFQRSGEATKAQQAVRRALQLDPTNSQVRNIMAALRHGDAIELSPEAEITSVGVRIPPPPARPVVEIMADEEEEERGQTPIGEAAEHAMGVLADFVFEGQLSPDAQTAIVQAIDWHRTGEARRALAAYERALSAGVSHPALNLNLGVLYQEVGEHNKALKVLPRVVGTSDYALAGHLAMGKAHLQRGEISEAIRYLLGALCLADSALSENTDRDGHEHFQETIQDEPTDKQMSIARALVHFLDSPDWRDQLGEVLQRFVERDQHHYVTSLMEIIEEQGQPEVASIIQRIDEFVARGMYEIALDEAHYAIERSPGYLPAHIRVAEILAKQGRAQDSADKYQVIATTYLVRGNPERAADLFAEVLQLSPMDVGARRRVIDMMREQGRTAEAIGHYRELADVYNSQADVASARETLSEALEYARERQADPGQISGLLSDLADIYSHRLELQKALSCYREILEMDPGNEQAALSVVDISFRAGDSVDAIATLDGYLRHCIEHGASERALSVLEEQVRSYPDEVVLRQRLADVYSQQGRVSEAIAQLDALGELQLEAGLHEEAIATIRKIISLNPPEVGSYRQLLEELRSGSDERDPLGD